MDVHRLECRSAIVRSLGARDQRGGTVVINDWWGERFGLSGRDAAVPCPSRRDPEGTPRPLDRVRRAEPRLSACAIVEIEHGLILSGAVQVGEQHQGLVRNGRKSIDSGLTDHLVRAMGDDLRGVCWPLVSNVQRPTD
jgi:hypothetical protein